MKKVRVYSVVVLVVIVVALLGSCSKLFKDLIGPEQQKMDKVSETTLSKTSDSYVFYLLSPVNGSCVEPNSTFQWQRYPGPPPGNQWCYYKLSINNDEIVQTIYDQDVTQSTVSGLQRNQTYSWGVIAYYSGPGCSPCGACGQVGIGSGGWTFSVKPVAPSAPTLTGSVYQGSPLLTWNAVPDAVRYEIFKTGIYLAATTETSYLDGSEWPVTMEGSTIIPGFHYEVRAVNDNGTCTNYSNSNIVSFWPDENYPSSSNYMKTL